MAHFLGLDISTTSSKALLIDHNGEVLGTASTPHDLSSPKPLWSEQDPEQWWVAAAQSIRNVLSQTGIPTSSIEAIGLTGQMHGLVLLDEDGNVLRPAILWNDQRCQSQCDEIHRRIGRDRFIQISGNVALPGFTAPKILWVAENEPEVYARVHHILLPKDFIRYKLTGNFAMDKADGSGTVLFDLKARNWSDEVLEELGIPSEWMPVTFEGTEVTGYVSKTAAEMTGLKQGIPVAAGGGDQEAGAVGVGAVEPGVIGLTVGTSGVIFAATSEPLVEPEGRLHAFCHAAPGLWHFMGVMLSAAGSLQWYRDALAPHLSFDELLREAADVPAGSEGLIFLPYLSGERTPYPDPLARGVLHGLTLRHTRGHMTRAILEGVAFGLKDIFNLIRGSGLEQIKQARLSGGGTKSALWCQIIADILESELMTVNTTEGGAFGAALLAGVGQGAWRDVGTACRETIQLTRKIDPDPAAFEVYRQRYQVYQELYPLLKGTYAKLM